ncbi:hypothetical protein X760_27865 [Mesorhizobium sp. LSHC422A00]|nr:hypothetical protein X760_27865 [Mesorhizobium sp. LSHC422A00]
MNVEALKNFTRGILQIETVRFRTEAQLRAFETAISNYPSDFFPFLHQRQMGKKVGKPAFRR